jgi:hypothetical protein
MSVVTKQTSETLSNGHIRVYNGTMIFLDKVLFIEKFTGFSHEQIRFYYDSKNRKEVEFESKQERDAEYLDIANALHKRYSNVDTFLSKGQGYKMISGKMNPDVADKIMEYL